MNVLVIFILCLVVILLLAAVIAFNFLRFRFKGDNTVLFLILFAISLVAVTGFTFLLIDYSSLEISAPQ